tara:strand:+ start:198 stop:1103 length:906 start_codon:yes stop_codon:yes gene_type:complete
MQIKAMTNTADLRARMEMWAGLVKKETGAGIKQFARVACENLAFNTQPYGIDEDAKKKGERAAIAGVSSVYYTTKDKGFKNALLEQAKKHYNYRKRQAGLLNFKERRKIGKGHAGFEQRLNGYIGSQNELALAKIALCFGWKGVILPSDTFDKSLHKNARNPVTGRVDKRKGNMHLAIGHRGDLEKYKREMAGRVGLSKAGWAKCADLISIPGRVSAATRGIPKWVKRHRNKLASGTISDKSNDPINPRVVMTNTTPWCSRVLTPANAQKALDIARNKFVEYMNRQIKYELRQKAKLRGAA